MLTTKESLYTKARHKKEYIEKTHETCVFSSIEYLDIGVQPILITIFIKRGIVYLILIALT